MFFRYSIDSFWMKKYDQDVYCWPICEKTLRSSPEKMIHQSYDTANVSICWNRGETISSVSSSLIKMLVSWCIISLTKQIPTICNGCKMKLILFGNIFQLNGFDGFNYKLKKRLLNPINRIFHWWEIYYQKKGNVKSIIMIMSTVNLRSDTS